MSEREVFIAALQKEDPAERRAYLDAACAGRPEVRRQVEQLLRLHEGAGSFLEKPAAEAAATGPHQEAAEPTAPGEAPGARIGPYKLLEQIGEGGMGTVWMAQQTEPVKRLVAVKLIKAGMDSKQVLARFEAERQALALMDHPHIARVLDAGTTKGRPFFVMDLVRGVPITRYCDAHRLTPRQRLELFIPVCQAVQHAHQKGIIHRDLKPSNVLVAVSDGQPVPKVIDFGVAKAAGQPLTDKTLVTGFGTIVGTLEYMSPEQAEVNQLDIDTRSDVYALGVLLYELLTGSTPFTRPEQGKGGLLEMLRVIREQEPTRPSAKLSTAEGLPALAAKRGTEPAKLTGLVRGELDWIVMKALEKDRARRYETANGLAMDLQRYLADEPVLACPPSTGYRLKKFVRRNTGLVVAASLVLLALVAGIVGTTWQAVRATDAERDALRAQRAEAARAEGERTATEQALKRLAQIQKSNEVLASVFADLDIRRIREGTEPLEAVLAERLVKAAAQLEGEAVGDTLLVADLQIQLSRTLRHLGYPQPAVDLCLKARDTRTAQLGADHADTLQSMSDLAAALLDAGDLDRALPLFEETLGFRKARLGADHHDTLASMNNLALGYQAAGKLDRALSLFEQTLKLLKAKLGADHPDTLASMGNLAVTYQDAGEYARALPLLEETVRLQKAKLGADHPDTLSSMSSLAAGYNDAGEVALALPRLEEILKLRKARLGADHPDTLLSMRNLAHCYKDAGEFALALPLLEEALKLTRAKLGAEHPKTLVGMNNLATGYQAAGNLDRALPLLEETLRLRKARLGADHPDTLASMNNLACGYQAAGKLDRALPLFEEALKLRKANLGADHPDRLASMASVGRAYQAAGNRGRALPLLEEALKLTRAKLGAEHPQTLTSMHDLASAYRVAGKLDRALPLHEEALKLTRAKLGADHPDTLATMNSLASAYWEARRLDLAVPLFEETLRLRKAKLGAEHPHTLESMNNLAAGYKAAGKLGQALPLYEDTVKLTRAKLGADHPHTLVSINNLAMGYLAARKQDLALPLFQEAAAGVETMRFQHEYADRIVNNLITCHEQLKQFDQAEAWRRKWLAVVRERSGAESVAAAGVLSALGSNLLQQKKWADAEAVLRECLAIREKRLPDGWTTCNSRSMLGGALLGQKKYADAEPLLVQGYEGMKNREAKIPPHSRPYLTSALERLAWLYEAWGKPDEAAKWRKELQAQQKAAKKGTSR
jgi:serine/threonine protein kinase